MRLMILSTLALAGLAAGIVWCAPVRNRMATVVFGEKAKIAQTAPQEDLGLRAKEGAASALRQVEATAAQLTGPADGPPAATTAHGVLAKPAPPAVQEKS